ncbi:hypothetical protein FNV43_RR03160 [Rhamnella rubrinervis]|uniref:Peptidase A1 domain-containing protein n=1 Tax=Rhamnella rubrinervis TaxID=2594499 RepID=A0A8K0HHH2_9ROSA|nr:hypothetical protein FNV43_RR03160 [Rhamnella rubrinervis]
MAIVSAVLVYFLFFQTYPTFLPTASGTATRNSTSRTRRLVAKLIHRDSVPHPYYNPNDTITCRAERAIRSSNLLLENLKGTTYSTGDIPNDSDVIWDAIISDEGLIFLANFSIGEPPVVQLAAIDTGSSVLWIQCIPCANCLHPPTPIFDPSKSLTYANLSCKTFCKNLMGCECDQFNHVKFSISYEDWTNINGTITEGIVAVPNITFGCGHVIQTRHREGRWTGVMGLGTGFASLARQFGSSNNLMDGILTRIKDDEIQRCELCYNGVVTRDLVGFPIGSFHFKGGADLVLDPASLFHQRTQDNFCMAI